jgi:methionyl aminopeptidase
MIICKSELEINLMREAGRIVAKTHEQLAKAVQVGISTLELDQIAEQVIKSHGATPSFKGYNGFPGSICASVNDELVHGIPGPRTLQEGDIISIDIGAYYQGFHGDSAWTYRVGMVSEQAEQLLIATEQALYQAIEQAKPGNRLSDISHAVQAYVEPKGFSVVREYVGHGIGSNLHEEPQIPNYGPPGRGPRLKPGMVLAIEPMVNAGERYVKTLLDNWTVVTEDRSICAHYEHTVVITEEGYEILTKL